MTQPNDSPVLKQLRAQLNEAHGTLLIVHKALLEHERVGYERENGRIASSGAFLQLLIHDPWFKWLGPLTTLIAQIDEFVSVKEPVDPEDGKALLAQARQLLNPDEKDGVFQSSYAKSVQESAEMAAAHGKWKTTLQQIDQMGRPS